MELSIGQLIKLILGVLVIAAVAYGLYVFFTNNINGTFGGLGLEDSAEVFLALL